MLCCYCQDTGLTSHILLVPVPLRRLFYFENRDFDRVLKIGKNFRSNSAACFRLYLMSTFKKTIIWLRGDRHFNAVPELIPRKYWWPLLHQSASVSFILGSRGCTNTLLYPAKSGVDAWEPRPLQWDLWMFCEPV